MRELNKTKVYSLEDLTSDELQQVYKATFTPSKRYKFLYFEGYQYHYSDNDFHKPTHNAKELFYTLENVQVDCRELSEEQINEMAGVFEKNGFKLSLDGITDEHFYLRLAKCGKSVNLYRLDDTKTKITYDKFMELFSEPQYEVTEKPKHYSKGIDTFARMEANCTKEECLAFAKGNIDKYNFRTKGQDLEDYKKIISYANWAIKLLKDEK